MEQNSIENQNLETHQISEQQEQSELKQQNIDQKPQEEQQEQQAQNQENLNINLEQNQDENQIQQQTTENDFNATNINTQTNNESFDQKTEQTQKILIDMPQEKTKIEDTSNNERTKIEDTSNNEKTKTENTSKKQSPKRILTESQDNQQQNKDENSTQKPQTLISTLIASKKIKQKIDHESQILANRIALLKQEELRTLKKIQETKKKTDDILQHKNILEERHKIKEKIMMSEKECKDTLTMQIQYQKSQNNKFFREQLQKKRENDYLTMKQQKMIINEISKRSKEQLLLEKVARTNLIKKQEALGNLRFQEFYENKHRMVQEHLQNKIDQQKFLAQERKIKALEMEKVELNLIRKLEFSQSVQRKVFEQLEDALNLPQIDYYSKYPKNQPQEKKKNKIKKKKRKNKIQGSASSGQLLLNNAYKQQMQLNM